MRPEGVGTVRRAALLVGLVLGGCALNPVSGKNELALVSESQEIAIGQQGAADVARSIGLYNDPGVQAYVSRLGLALAAGTERPDLPWEYHVLDDPSVNAFALPGGFIFVTRGLLTHMTNEAELATVLGHENGHVAARHSVQQMSRGQLAQLGLGIGSLLSSGFRQYSAVASTGLNLLFLKFGRDDETQADELGFRYALAGGYDVRQMVSVFRMLDEQGHLSGGGRLPEWQATHPNPGNRIKATQALLAAVDEDLNSKKVGEYEFLRLIDGMVYGEDPRQGFFRGPLFLHPDLRFEFRFPDGWQTHNGSDAVLGGSPAHDALIELRGAAGTAAQAAQEFFGREGLQAGTVSQGSINGFPSLTGSFSAQTNQGTLRGMATFLEYGGTTYQLMAVTISEKFDGYRAVLQRSLGSFGRLTDPAALAAEPKRLRLERVRRAMTLERFNVQYPSTISLDEVALINGIGSTGSLRAGQTAKRVVGGSLPK